MISVKRRKLNTEHIQFKIEGSKVNFDSLNDECFNNIFDWLSIKDLCRLKVTCKRLYILAREHFQKTYGQLCICHSKNSGCKYVKSFATQIQKVYFPKDVDRVSAMGLMLNQNVKHISIMSNSLYIDSIDLFLKNKLKNVQSVSVYVLSDSLLKLFTNLEYIAYSNFYSVDFKLTGNYPALRQFDWKFGEISNKIELDSFFMRHPNLKTFSSEAPIKTTNWLLNSGIKFDDLVLDIRHVQINSVYDNVYSLHKNQQIKKLHLKISEDFLFCPDFTTLTFLESIEARVVAESDTVVNAFISLPNLKLLILSQYFVPNQTYKLDKCHYELLAQKLDKLEEFHTNTFCCIDDLIPFVRYSRKMKCIYIFGQNFCNTATTTIQKLDKERRKLENACKLTIYMDEEYYLNMKNNSSTSNYGLVEIKRTDSYPLSKHPLRPNYL